MKIYNIQINLSLKSEKDVEDIEKGIKRAITRGLDTEPNYIAIPKNIDFQDIVISDITPEEPKNIPITYGLIKATCGWSKWCDVTNMNHYAINEWGDYPENEIFWITESQAKELNFITPKC